MSQRVEEVPCGAEAVGNRAPPPLKVAATKIGSGVYTDTRIEAAKQPGNIVP